MGAGAELLGRRRGGTGLVNYNGMELLVAHGVARARRDGDFLTLVYIEIQTGDRASGEALTTRLAVSITDHLRASDVVARFGPLDLCLMLPQTDATNSLIVIEYLGAVYSGNPTSFGAFSARIGRATYDPSSEWTDLDELLLAARSDLAASGLRWHSRGG